MNASSYLIFALANAVAATSFASFQQVSSQSLTTTKDCDAYNCQTPAPMTVAPNSSVIAVGPGVEAGFSIFEIKNGKLVLNVYKDYWGPALGEVNLRTISFSPDSKKLAFSYTDASGQLGYASTYTLGSTKHEEEYYAENAFFLQTSQNRLVLSQENFFRIYDNQNGKNRELAAYAHNYPDGYNWLVPNNMKAPLVAAKYNYLVPFKVGNLDGSQTVTEPQEAQTYAFMTLGMPVDLPIHSPGDSAHQWPGQLDTLASHPQYASNSKYLAAINGYWLGDSVSGAGTFTKALHLIKVTGASDDNMLSVKQSIECAPSIAGSPLYPRLEESTMVFFSADSKSLVAACGSGIATYGIANDRLQLSSSIKTTDILISASKSAKIALAKVRNSNAIAVYSISSVRIKKANVVSMPSQIVGTEISGDESALLITSADGTVKMFGITENKILGEVKVGANPNAKFAGNDHFAVLASAHDKTVRLFSVR